MENKLILSENQIQDKIHTIRGLQVILDEDIAELYQVDTRRLNEQVKRNIKRFPQEFMFKLTEFEFNSLRSQIATLEKGSGAHRKYLPYAFTEQGVAMLSSVLKSDTAIKVSIQIMNVFVALRRFLSSNVQFFQRLDVVERKQLDQDKKFEIIFDAIQNRDLKPEKGIFFEGQIFDSHKFFSDIIIEAKSSIILIDNYIDDSVLNLFSKRRNEVKVIIFTKELTSQLKLDLEKYNAQYPLIEMKEFKQSHDRFLIIDNQKVYHFGASLKDLGKKWFAFSIFEKEAFTLLEKLGIK